ncbi:hypothetical protein C922_03333 [Plasmodium inui San Antonio 1]|uniref:Uncharacterized protein n=1 Tax=Plasmodium inui San Antonio 1 TaxID=1237626 RepID=W7A4B1_9APIC|nr:hypothetical protein C922_03333 [Plasmodium inui San Antonio 1]EUD66138.1 hypothetical protein C922_03333 [Plasmodium inui San Antonio 1]
MNVLVIYEKIILFPKENLSEANQFYTYFYAPFAKKVTFFTRPFWVNRKMGSFEEATHYESRYTQYHVIVNAIKLFLLKKYSQNWSPSIHRWNIVECLGQNNPSYLSFAQGGRRDSNNDTTQVGRNTSQKKTNVNSSNGESQLDGDHSQVTPYDETEKMPQDAESHLSERGPVAIHYWKKMKKNKTNTLHYNIDPSAKTKKIQIYYNSEMTDMERKICKIKKFLRNGNPVDILLICDSHSQSDSKVTQKGGVGEKKKRNKKSRESTSEGGPTSICKVRNNITNSALSLQLSEAKSSQHVNVRMNFLMRHLAKIAIVEETFWHVQNGKRVILIKLYPRPLWNCSTEGCAGNRRVSTASFPNAADKQVEDKRVEDKLVEDKRVEDKRVENKRVEDKRVENKRVEGKRAEEKRAADKWAKDATVQ